MMVLITTKEETPLRMLKKCSTMKIIKITIGKMRGIIEMVKREENSTECMSLLLTTKAKIVQKILLTMEEQEDKITEQETDTFLPQTQIKSMAGKLTIIEVEEVLELISIKLVHINRRRKEHLICKFQLHLSKKMSKKDKHLLIKIK